MNPVIQFFIRFLKIFFRSLFKAASHNHVSPTHEQNSQHSTATTEPAPTETTEPPRKHRHRRTSVTETTTRTTTVSESQSSPELALEKSYGLSK